MFHEQPPDEPPLSQEEVNNLSDGKTVIVKPPHTTPGEWTISTEGTLRVAETAGMRLVLEPVGGGPEDTRVWRSERDPTDELVNAKAIVSELESEHDE